MVKDNHITSNKNIEETINKIKKSNIPIQVEVDTIDQLKKCLNCPNIDAFLLDNMEPKTIKECVYLIKKKTPKTFIEVSGGITLKTLNRFLIKNIDAISIGSTIHQATSQNITLEINSK